MDARMVNLLEANGEQGVLCSDGEKEELSCG
jgi:hypothetical protein